MAYEVDGRKLTTFPSHVEDGRCPPGYETPPGWQEDICGVRRMADLPENARRYVQRISELVGAPVERSSRWAPDREQTMPASDCLLSPAG